METKINGNIVDRKTKPCESGKISSFSAFARFIIKTIKLNKIENPNV